MPAHTRPDYDPSDRDTHVTRQPVSHTRHSCVSVWPKCLAEISRPIHTSFPGTYTRAFVYNCAPPSPIYISSAVCRPWTAFCAHLHLSSLTPAPSGDFTGSLFAASAPALMNFGGDKASELVTALAIAGETEESVQAVALAIAGEIVCAAHAPTFFAGERAEATLNGITRTGVAPTIAPSLAAFLAANFAAALPVASGGSLLRMRFRAFLSCVKSTSPLPFASMSSKSTLRSLTGASKPIFSIARRNFTAHVSVTRVVPQLELRDQP